jgi:rubrerythrin
MPDFESLKRHHDLLFGLIEMRDIEALIVKETASFGKLTKDDRAKDVFLRWNRDSEGHLGTCQRIIEEVRQNTLYGECETCMNAHFHSSYGRKRVLELFHEPTETDLTIKDLYLVAKSHLEIEGDAQRRYAEMSDMTDDEETKKLLMTLSEVERGHQMEAQMLVDIFEKVYGDRVKPTRISANKS